MVVAEYSPDSVDEVSRIRVELEPLAVQLAVERADADQVAEMRQAHEALRAAQEGPGRRSEAATLERALARRPSTGMPARRCSPSSSRAYGAGVPVEAVWRSRRAKRSLEEHEEIMVAIERGDALEARELMRRHIESGVTITDREHASSGASVERRPTSCG